MAMLPSVRRVVISQAAFASLVAVVLLAEVVPFFGWLLNPHSGLGGVGLGLLLLLTVCVLVVLLVSLPPAAKALVQNPSQRTPLQIVAVALGCVMVLAIAAWLAGAFHH